MNLEEKYIEYVRDTIDLTVQGSEDEFPVMGRVLVKASIATWEQLAKLEEQGHLKSIQIDVPSVVFPSRTIKEKAYYTERRVPKLVESMLPKKQSFEIVKD